MIDLSKSECNQVMKALSIREPLLADYWKAQVQSCPIGSTEWAETKEELDATVSAMNKVHNALLSHDG